MDDPAGPPPIIATSKSGFVIPTLPPEVFLILLFGPNVLLADLLERVHGHVSEQLVPRMLCILLDLGHHLLHFLKYRWRGIVVDVALQQLEHIQPIARVADEIRE